MEMRDDSYEFGQLVGDAAATIIGSHELATGITGEVGGLMLDLTGVGAAVGVPVQVVSGTLMVHGGSTAVIGATHLMSGITAQAWLVGPFQRR